MVCSQRSIQIHTSLHCSADEACLLTDVLFGMVFLAAGRDKMPPKYAFFNSTRVHRQLGYKAQICVLARLCHS